MIGPINENREKLSGRVNGTGMERQLPFGDLVENTTRETKPQTVGAALVDAQTTHPTLFDPQTHVNTFSVVEPLSNAEAVQNRANQIPEYFKESRQNVGPAP